MTVNTSTVRTVDLPLGPGGQTLRVIEHRDAQGRPEALSLAVGFGGADGSFTRPSWGDRLLTLPASVSGPLRDALTALSDTPQP